MQRQIEKVWLDNKYINAVTKDGLKARYQISSWPRLAAANRSQLEDFYLSYTGIHKKEDKISVWCKYRALKISVLCNFDVNNSLFGEIPLNLHEHKREYEHEKENI